MNAHARALNWKKGGSLLAILVSMGGAVACSDSSTPDPMAELTPGPAGQPTSANPPAPTTTNPPVTSGSPTTGSPNQPPASGAAGSAAGMNPTPSMPEAKPPVMAPTPAEDGSEARYPDACSERRGSWSKPCSDNPDPCNLKSGFPGDEYCLLPPPEGKGIQIHFGPKDYKDAAEVAKYTIKPNEEFNSYAIVNVPLTEDKFYKYIKISMRPGSHHLINTIISGQPEEGFVAGRAGCEGQSMGSFQGTQNLIVESPPQGIPAPENVGLGRPLPGNSSICQNYHRYNVTENPQLSEIWYNVWFVEEEDITQKANGIMINAGPRTGIAPGQKVVLTTTSTISGDGRIISLFGHRHAATERFAAWLNDQLIYDSWDWVESRLFNYDSVTMNPAINSAAKSDGAVSGVLKIKQGDKIKIECHVNNTTDQTLRFANELFTGEMCILFGSSVGVGIN